MSKLHLISHTHWDREWYLTYQQFRLKLVKLIDLLLILLKQDPDFKHFLLDGQTIVLDDYLEMRPSNFEILRMHILDGRLLIGPWHVLSDEFLVSPEATIRNLLQGDRTARRFGAKMMVGYIPDPFGHISQMPQILLGFDIHYASVQRGLSDEPCELWWQSPDGSKVLLSYLRDGYGNAAGLPTFDQERFVSEVQRLRDSLLPNTNSNQLLLMNGTDHMLPSLNLSASIDYANERLKEDFLLHSSLPEYFSAINNQLLDDRIPLPSVMGELRSPRRHHLLPGVLSTRIWIKQRNHQCETLLEKWAEPFSTFANLLENRKSEQSGLSLDDRLHSGILPDPAAILRQAWRLLMECHPHDSICGCSIDQVHREMEPRFDQVEQIGEEITHQSLDYLSEMIDTRVNQELASQRSSESLVTPSPRSNKFIAAIVVFNPTAGPRTGLVSLELAVPPDVEQFEIIDDTGNIMPENVSGMLSRDLFSAVLDRQELISVLGTINEGRVAGMVIRDFVFKRDSNQLDIKVVLEDAEKVDIEKWRKGFRQLQVFLADPSIDTFIVRARSATTNQVAFIARDAPGYGYKTFWISDRTLPVITQHKIRKVNRVMKMLLPIANNLTNLAVLNKALSKLSLMRNPEYTPFKAPYIIENEYLSMEVSTKDGTLTLHDKNNGIVYKGLNRFVDGGDRGDEYNYCPPFEDRVIKEVHVDEIHIQRELSLQAIRIKLSMQVPKGLRPDRRARAIDQVSISIETHLYLYPGVPRLDIHTEVHNPARDHRLRVHFPTSFNLGEEQRFADHDGHFTVERRPIGIPAYDESWIEQPRPEVPQRIFSDISDGKHGLMLANRGLPEVEVLMNSQGRPEIALTLLRCVGWLSREDLATRKGHAGPELATPGAQMIGDWKYDYAVIPHDGDWQSSYQEAYAFNVPLRAVSTSLHPSLLPRKSSLVQITPREFIISSIKTAEIGHGWILRGYNISPDSIQVRIKPLLHFDRADKVNLAEDLIHKLEINQQGEIDVPVRAKEILTVKLW